MDHFMKFNPIISIILLINICLCQYSFGNLTDQKQKKVIEIVQTKENKNRKAKELDIKKLFQISGMDSIEKLSQDLFDIRIKQIITEKQSKIKNKEDIQAYLNYAKELMFTLTTEIIDHKLVQFYSENYSHREIKKMIRFYKSSLGKKMINIQPNLNLELLELIHSKYYPLLEKQLKDKINDLKNKKE